MKFQLSAISAFLLFIVCSSIKDSSAGKKALVYMYLIMKMY